MVAELGSPEWNLSHKACETDDTTMMDEAISMIAREDLNVFYKIASYDGIKHNSIAVLSHLIERGMDVKILKPLDVADGGNTSKAILELLLAHSWDINMRDVSASGGNGEPFMWHVIEDDDTVAWCLEHGASVHAAKSGRPCEPILEKVAGWGSISTFELLRSAGAPLGARVLHLAVETATYGRSHPEDAEKVTNGEEKDTSSHIERMDMVRHLLDVVGLDVNAPDQPEGTYLRDRRGTPICYIPTSAWLERDTRELTWLLLDRGADPTPALELAKRKGNTKFTEHVEAWKAQQDNGRKCCVQ